MKASFHVSCQWDKSSSSRPNCDVKGPCFLGVSSPRFPQHWVPIHLQKALLSVTGVYKKPFRVNSHLFIYQRITDHLLSVSGTMLMDARDTAENNKALPPMQLTSWCTDAKSSYMLEGFALNQAPHCTSVFLFLPVCLLLEIKPRALHIQGTTLPLNTPSTPHFIFTVLREPLIISVHFTKEGETDLLQARGTRLWSHHKTQCRLMTALSKPEWEA